MIVAVTDAGGRMLWVEGDPPCASRAAGMHFVEGARWSEDVAGTNAPGTALAVDHAVQIYGSEHYRRPVQPWSCSAAPVHDPVSGLLLGAIDVTGGDHVASPHVLTLVRATVAAVESELRWLHREQLAAGRRRVAPLRPAGAPARRARPRTGPPRPAVRSGRAVAAALRAPPPAGRGRTGRRGPLGDPALRRVPPGRRRAGHRPRRALPAAPAGGRRPRRLPALPAARPPRHRSRPGPPAARPRRGRPGAGPLSRRGPARLARARRGRAPGNGRRLLRQAVLRSRRPELLLRYAQLPEARDDAAVWQACLEWLPPSSPRRAAAAAHLLRLRRAPRPR